MKNIKTLGDAGDIKEVADGYARNFLFPQKLAEPATDSSIKKIQDQKAKQAKSAEHDLLETEKKAEKLNGVLVEVVGKSNDDGKLYAALTAAAIVKALKKKGFDINKDQVVMPEPIKELGEYQLKVVWNHGLESEITINVSN